MVFAQLVFSEGSAGRPVAEAVAAVAVVSGHCWPVTLRGRGGRGVATGFGALLFVATPAWATAVLFFAIALALTRMVSVSSLASVIGALVGYLLFCATGWLHFNWWTFLFIVIAGTVVFIRHRSNIERIVRGVEPRVGTS